MEVSPRLARWVEANFERGSAARVLAEWQQLPPIAVGGQNVERMQASLVIRTRGDLSAFQQRLSLVNTDWRDALVGADLADEDWPDRLDALLGTDR